MPGMRPIQHRDMGGHTVTLKLAVHDDDHWQVMGSHIPTDSMAKQGTTWALRACDTGVPATPLDVKLKARFLFVRLQLSAILDFADLQPRS